MELLSEGRELPKKSISKKSLKGSIPRVSFLLIRCLIKKILIVKNFYCAIIVAAKTMAKMPLLTGSSLLAGIGLVQNKIMSALNFC
jgi:hypothetical protein